ncbi:putative protein translocase subunit SecA, SecA motor DEAD [Helianthus annuus]|nr:putative protein translocase subunit SecA, SecA motor DEAD [Helianthus annuus]KAJ0946120.1 putative protein translocase subunit SecA, SecA motor DEAD [Helianthus annuus]
MAFYSILKDASFCGRSVENSEYLSSLLRDSMIPHNVLNAWPKAAREAQTVAQAGRKFAITISTNMAGRGTNIILGGNPKVCYSFRFLMHVICSKRQRT